MARGAEGAVYFNDSFSSGTFPGYGYPAATDDPCYNSYPDQFTEDSIDYVDPPYSIRFNMMNYTLNGYDLCSYIGKDLINSINEPRTIYMGFYTKFSANHFWEGDAFNKHLEIRGGGSTRMIFGLGRWESEQLQTMGLLSSDLHKPTPSLWIEANGDGSWHEFNNPSGGFFVQNINMATPMYLQTGSWHSIIIRLDITSTRNGTVEMWIDGTKVIQQTSLRTIQAGVPYLSTLIGGTHNQPLYDSRVDSYKYYDKYIITDSWIDIVNGGYLSVSASDITPPAAPSGLSVN